MRKFYISGGADMFWMPTSAQTLRGAKTIASKTYHAAFGGKISVAEAEDHGENGVHYIPVAVKYGYDNWRQA